MNADRRLQERKQPERMVFCKLGGEATLGAVQDYHGSPEPLSLGPGSLEPGLDALTDAHALLFCNGRNDGDNSTPENPTGIDVLLGEAPVIDAVGREAVEMLEGFEYAFAGGPVKRPKQKPIKLALAGSSTVRWRGRVRCAGFG